MIRACAAALLILSAAAPAAAAVRPEPAASQTVAPDSREGQAIVREIRRIDRVIEAIVGNPFSPRPLSGGDTRTLKGTVVMPTEGGYGVAYNYQPILRFSQSPFPSAQGRTRAVKMRLAELRTRRDALAARLASAS